MVTWSCCRVQRVNSSIHIGASVLNLKQCSDACYTACISQVSNWFIVRAYREVQGPRTYCRQWSHRLQWTRGYSTLFCPCSPSEHGWVTSAELTLNKWGSLNQSKQKSINTYQLLILRNWNPRFWPCRKTLAMYTRETKNKLGIGSQYCDLVHQAKAKLVIVHPHYNSYGLCSF